MHTICRLTFTIQAKIGGHMIMNNRETRINETHFLVGTTKVLQYVYRWDFILPNHCLEVSDSPQNCIHPLIVPDVTDDVMFFRYKFLSVGISNILNFFFQYTLLLFFQPSIIISWGDWLDDLSGLLEYHYEIHTVSLRGSSLSENGALVDSGTLFLNHTSVFEMLSFLLTIFQFT